MAGRAVLLIPHRSDAADEGALPGDYGKILAIVREADGPVQVRAGGERPGLDASVRGKLESLRAKMTKLADRGWVHKMLASSSLVQPCPTQMTAFMISGSSVAVGDSNSAVTVADKPSMGPMTSSCFTKEWAAKINRPSVGLKANGSRDSSRLPAPAGPRRTSGARSGGTSSTPPIRT